MLFCSITGGLVGVVVLNEQCGEEYLSYCKSCYVCEVFRIFFNWQVHELVRLLNDDWTVPVICSRLHT